MRKYRSDPAAAGSQRRPDCHLPFTPDGVRQQEVGHVRAGDEQQEQHGQARDRGTDPESLVEDVVLQSQDSGPVPGIRLGEIDGQLWAAMRSVSSAACACVKPSFTRASTLM